MDKIYGNVLFVETVYYHKFPHTHLYTLEKYLAVVGVLVSLGYGFCKGSGVRVFDSGDENVLGLPLVGVTGWSPSVPRAGAVIRILGRFLEDRCPPSGEG